MYKKILLVSLVILFSTTLISKEKVFLDLVFLKNISEKVEVRNSNDMKTVIGIWSVDKIIKLILDDEMIITSIFKDKSWRNGERVSVINEEDKTFIRTKPDQFISNNLGELPEISVF